MQRFGQRPLIGKRYELRPGAYAILPRNGEALLTFQDGPIPQFQLPGGGIDPGESPLAALHREVLEETGWRIGHARRLGAFRRFAYMPDYDKWAEKICHIYVAHPVRALHAPTEPGHSATWLPFDDAARLLAVDGDRAFLSDYLAGRRPR